MTPAGPLFPIQKNIGARVNGSSTLHGFVNIQGRVVVPPTFEDAQEFVEGLAPVRTGDSKWAYLDGTGATVGTVRAKEARSFSDGLARIRRSERESRVNVNRWGYIDHEFKEVIGLKFNEAKDFSEGLAAVAVDLEFDTRWHFIDATGKPLGKDTYVNASSFSDGLAVVVGDDIRSRFIDHSGKLVFAKSFEDACPFSEGLALVQAEQGWGVIDKSGTYVVPPGLEYPSIQNLGWPNEPDPWVNNELHFSAGRLLIEVGERWGFIDRTGTQVIPPTFLDAKSFSEARACVKTDSGLWGFIDPDGKLVIDAQFHSAYPFRDGLARVTI